MAYNRNYSKEEAKEYGKEKMAEAIAKLEDGIRKITNADQWKEYLTIQSKFHKYSFGNCLLIWAQCPDARRVAGFSTWKTLGRYVRKGEKGIQIFAPLAYKKEFQNDAGEMSTRTILAGFKVVHVFDVSQTDGQELPEPRVIEKLHGNDMGYLWNRLVKYNAGNGITVNLADEDKLGKASGNFSPKNNVINVLSSDPLNEQICTLVHETAHSDLYGDGKEEETSLTRVQRELEAESVAYIVLQCLGHDTSKCSFGYLAEYAKSAENYVEAMKTLGQRVQKCASKILDGIGVKGEKEEVA